jgi:hypothetical protein
MVTYLGVGQTLLRVGSFAIERPEEISRTAQQLTQSSSLDKRTKKADLWWTPSNFFERITDNLP